MKKYAKWIIKASEISLPQKICKIHFAYSNIKATNRTSNKVENITTLTNNMFIINSSVFLLKVYVAYSSPANKGFNMYGPRPHKINKGFNRSEVLNPHG